MDEEKMGKVVLIVILLLAAFTAVKTFVESVNIADIPEVVRPHWTLVVVIFTTGVGAFVIAIAYNIYGYLTAYYGGLATAYVPEKLYKTLVQFAGYFTTIDATLAVAQIYMGETEWLWIVSMIAKIVFVAVKAVINEVEKLRATPKT